MKYIKVFENDAAEDLRDKRLLDRLIAFHESGLLNLADLDFREGSTRNEYEFYVTSRFGEVGFHYDNFEISEYTGEGDYDVLIYYDRQIGDTLYTTIAKGHGRARHHEELEEVNPTQLLRIYNKKIN
jgi:hypothetical protein